MTSLATLILRLHELRRQSQFYISQFLNSLRLLSRPWRVGPVDLHLTATARSILLRIQYFHPAALIRISAPPLLRGGKPAPILRSKQEETLQPEGPPLLTILQEPFEDLQKRVHEFPDVAQSLIRPMLQIGMGEQRTIMPPSAVTKAGPRVQSLGAVKTASIPQTRRMLLEPIREAELRYPSGETPQEEAFREGIVEAWLQRQEETGTRPSMSFAEAHQIYHEFFMAYVSTGIMPPDLFSARFMETPGNLTFEQVRTHLRARLESVTPPPKPSNEILPEEHTPGIPPILLPTFLAATLWGKGSLFFAPPAQLYPPPSYPETTIASTQTARGEPQQSLEKSITQAPVELTSASIPSGRLPDAQTLEQSRGLSEPFPAPATTITAEERRYTFRGEESSETRPTLSTQPPILQHEPNRSMSETESSDRMPGIPAEEQRNLNSALMIIPPPRMEQPSYEWQLGPKATTEKKPLTLKHPLEALRTSIREPVHSKPYSPAEAIYSTLSAHVGIQAQRALIGMLEHPTPSHETKLPAEGVFGEVTEDGRSRLSTAVERGIGPAEPAARLPEASESKPLPLYMQPPVNLPGGESAAQQRVLPMLLPPSNVSPTRGDGITLKTEAPRIEEETQEPVEEEEEKAALTEAELREQLRRMGRIISEEARRHLGSA